jgi:hypothetical protein
MSSNKKRLAFISGSLAVALVGGGLAIAYWTTTGTGTGAGAVGTSTAVTVTQDSTVSGLVPGGPADDLDFTINNGGTGPQTINSVAVSVSQVTKAVGAPAGDCTAADFTVTQPNIGGAVALAVGDTAFTSGNGSGGPANTGAKVSMVNDLVNNQDGCKGATLEFTYTVS